MLNLASTLMFFDMSNSHMRSFVMLRYLGPLISYDRSYDTLYKKLYNIYETDLPYNSSPRAKWKEIALSKLKYRTLL